MGPGEGMSGPGVGSGISGWFGGMPGEGPGAGDGGAGAGPGCGAGSFGMPCPPCQGGERASAADVPGERVDALRQLAFLAPPFLSSCGDGGGKLAASAAAAAIASDSCADSLAFGTWTTTCGRAKAIPFFSKASRTRW
jgi:hypothetical protein